MVLTLDLLTKVLALLWLGAHPWPVRGQVRVVEVWSTEMIWPLDGPLWLLGVQFAVFAALLLGGCHWLSRDIPSLWIPTGLVLGGAAGPALSRAASGRVLDWLAFGHYAMNLADLAVLVALVVALGLVARLAASTD